MNKNMQTAVTLQMLSVMALVGSVGLIIYGAVENPVWIAVGAASFISCLLLVDSLSGITDNIKFHIQNEKQNLKSSELVGDEASVLRTDSTYHKKAS